MAEFAALEGWRWSGKLAWSFVVLINATLVVTCGAFSHKRLGSPAHSLSVTCVSHNWEDMVCEWHPASPDHTQRLIWAILPSHQAYYCPHQLGNKCKWLALDGADSFRAGMRYFLRVDIRDENGRILKSSSVIMIDTDKIVKPAEVIRLSVASRATNGSKLVTWSPPARFNAFLLPLEYKVSWAAVSDNFEPLTDTVVATVQDTQTMISGLKHDALYRIEVSARPLAGGFWSEPSTVVIKTQAEPMDYTSEPGIPGFDMGEDFNLGSPKGG